MSYIALVGLTLIVVRSAIFERVQQLWPALFRCAMCTGMWIGIAAGAYGVTSFGQGRVLDAVLVGGATSVLSMLTDAVLLRLLGDPGE